MATQTSARVDVGFSLATSPRNFAGLVKSIAFVNVVDVLFSQIEIILVFLCVAEVGRFCVPIGDTEGETLRQTCRSAIKAYGDVRNIYVGFYGLTVRPDTLEIPRSLAPHLV